VDDRGASENIGENVNFCGLATSRRPDGLCPSPLPAVSRAVRPDVAAVQGRRFGDPTGLGQRSMHPALETASRPPVVAFEDRMRAVRRPGITLNGSRILRLFRRLIRQIFSLRSDMLGYIPGVVPYTPNETGRSPRLPR
jgi:hypothetical protein